MNPCNQQGWVKLWRGLLEWEWYGVPHMVEVLVDLMLHASHRACTVRGVRLKRGQLMTSVRALSERLNKTPDVIRTVLKRMEQSQTIKREATRNFSIITICEYDSYAEDEPTEKRANPKQIPNKSQTFPEPLPNKSQTFPELNALKDSDLASKGEVDCADAPFSFPDPEEAKLPKQTATAYIRTRVKEERRKKKEEELGFDKSKPREEAAERPLSAANASDASLRHRTEDAELEKPSAGAQAPFTGQPPLSAAKGEGGRGAAEPAVDADDLARFFNAEVERTGSLLPKVARVTDARRTTLLARAREYGPEALYTVVRKAVASSFLNGSTGWKASFDWMFGPRNFVKVLEGNYDNQTQRNSNANNGKTDWGGTKPGRTETEAIGPQDYSTVF